MSAIIIFLVIFVQKKCKDFYLWYNSASVYIPLNINKTSQYCLNFCLDKYPVAHNFKLTITDT